MGSFIVKGGKTLRGTLTPQGAKNEALQVISAVLLTAEDVIIDNLPNIVDVVGYRPRSCTIFFEFLS